MRRHQTRSNNKQPSYATLQQICCKFLLNLPKQELKQKQRLAYHYQKAYYYYIDEVLGQKSDQNHQRAQQKRLRFFQSLNDMLRQIGKSSYLEVNAIVKILNKNKPTCGAIILGERGQKVLVIECGGKLGFPKGGKNQNETCEDCAARQTKQQVGIFIHNKIDSSDKVQFLSIGQIPAVYYIVRNFDTRQPLKIDKNQIDDAYWMPVSEISKNIWMLTSKSKSAWKMFEETHVVQPKITMENFLKTYLKQNKISAPTLIENNPLLDFKFDKQRLSAALRGQ